ncbi:DUF294 nucleotidyltransferase-like domain-containing protein [Bacillus massiliigorillae]|uniref:DUF294 nucleotidyltransferase-like domain-containing protein n=1 Tax=Bacillus massiliigorillae TaxID=1243664 RepID=UPI00039C0B3C|nr:DUF294 nucleotidyltransferase-like domain-containing protein [Bacillus massiliigorillae]
MKTLETYEDIKMWKDAHIIHNLTDTISLNSFHDVVMRKVFRLASAQINNEKPHCDFCWFITGSGGRFEQGLISDQDHGIIFTSYSEENRDYFLQLGKEISDGLDIVGYPYCKGNIMSSNPLWCKSIDEWENQLYLWMDEGSYESIRNLQIFIDCRCLVGEDLYISELKNFIFDFQRNNPSLLKRVMENALYIKKAISPLGKLLVSNVNGYQHSIDLKYSAFIPYVNAIRILAIKENLLESSTEGRMKELLLIEKYRGIIEESLMNFQILLQYRLSQSKVDTYEDTHFLNLTNLNQAEKKEIKKILKDGQSLHRYVVNLIKKDVSYGV